MAVATNQRYRRHRATLRRCIMVSIVPDYGRGDALTFEPANNNSAVSLTPVRGCKLTVYRLFFWDMESRTATSSISRSTKLAQKSMAGSDRSRHTGQLRIKKGECRHFSMGTFWELLGEAYEY